MNERAFWAGLAITGLGGVIAAAERVMLARLVERPLTGAVASIRQLPEVALGLGVVVMMAGAVADAI